MSIYWKYNHRCLNKAIITSSLICDEKKNKKKSFHLKFLPLKFLNFSYGSSRQLEATLFIIQANNEKAQDMLNIRNESYRKSLCQVSLLFIRNREEFKQHIKSKPKQMNIFLNEWRKYLDELKISDTYVNSKLLKQKGKDMNKEDLHLLNPKQKESLKSLESEAKGLFTKKQ